MSGQGAGKLPAASASSSAGSAAAVADGQFDEPEIRVEGLLKATGAARYAADISLPGMLYAAFLTSPLPHARLLSVDVGAARDVSGVRAVLTGRDIGHVRFGRRLLDRPVLAVDRVRFAGECVAAVAAESREAAEEAAERIEVEYEELPAVLSPEDALAPWATVLHPLRDQYRYLGGKRPPVPHPNVQGHHVVIKGEPDIEGALAAADRVFEHVFTTPRQHHGYIEPPAALVWIDERDVVHVITCNKSPLALRGQMSAALGLPPERLDIDSGFIGGDFGGKGYTVSEYACYFLARRTGRPVKAVASYADELAAGNPRHQATVTLRTGVDREGRFVAHDARVVFDGGAYASAKPLPHLVLAGGTSTLAAYRVPNARIEVLTVYTNTVPCGHMRSPGEVQALFAGESHVDMIAGELGVDRIELRLRNAVRCGDTGLGGQRFREARAVPVLETLRNASGWTSWPRRPHAGRGIALGVRHVGGGAMSVRLHVGRDGRITVLSGLPDQGGGAQTVIQRVAAATLSVAPTRVSVTRCSTQRAPADPGVGASRVTHLASRATQAGAEQLKRLLEATARTELGCGHPMRLEHDRFVGGGDVVPFEQVAARIPETGIDVEGTYDASAHDPGEPGHFSFAACMVEVSVDPATGQPTVHDAMIVADVGTVINPVAHRGQLAGGFVFGLGAALMEELRVEDGIVTSSTLGELKLPTSPDCPPLRIVHVPTRIGPGAFGAKMAGELTNALVAPAVANAVADAVGARITSLPVTADKIHRALRKGA
jgi:CO/xanthine dehydrogenase Mo-binding subunit